MFVFFKIKFNLKGSNIYLLPIRLLCGVGFLFHLSSILFQVQNDELVYGQHVRELDGKRSEVWFCFNFNQSLIERNVTLTGHHLEAVTSHLSIEALFERISFLDEHNRWIQLDRSNFSSNHQISIEPAFLYGKKCFKVRNSIRYEPSQFYRFDSLEGEPQHAILKVTFNKSFLLEEHRKMVFFSRNPNDRNTNEALLSKAVYLDWVNYNKSYLITEESQTLVNNDRFEFLKFHFWKNPRTLLFAPRKPDVSMYLANLKNKFKRKHNVTTLELPLQRDEFHLTINDTLFRQYYDEVQLPQDQSTPDSLVYGRQILDNFAFIFSDANYTTEDLVFRINFNDWKLEYRNAENMAKLILNFFNALSLSLDLSMFSTFLMRFDLLRGQSIFSRIGNKIRTKLGNRIGTRFCKFFSSPVASNTQTDQGSPEPIRTICKSLSGPKKLQEAEEDLESFQLSGFETRSDLETELASFIVGDQLLARTGCEVMDEQASADDKNPVEDSRDSDEVERLST